MGYDTSKSNNNEHLKPHGLVLCGGRSSRMGEDKSMLTYHGLPQCYYVYHLLEPVCEKVFISCKIQQEKHFSPGYSIMADLPAYDNIGPMAALLTAFKSYPEKSFLVTGIDYPFVAAADIRNFLASCHDNVPAAFFNFETRFYEPTLAFYNNAAGPVLLEMFRANNYSLQQFLIANKAQAYFPESIQTIESVDTAEAHHNALQIINTQS